MFKDIAPLIKPDLEIYYYTFLFLIALFAVVVQYIPKRKKAAEVFDKRLKALKSLDIESSDKNALYKFTILAKEYNCRKCEDKLKLALNYIEPYKYKNSDIKIDKKAKEAIKRYIKCLD